VTSETSEVGVSNSTVHLVDVRNKMVAGSFTMQNVTAVVSAWDSLIIVTGAGKVTMLHEVFALAPYSCVWLYSATVKLIFLLLYFLYLCMDHSTCLFCVLC
jgi:hypothetical protein